MRCDDEGEHEERRKQHGVFRVRARTVVVEGRSKEKIRNFSQKKKKRKP